LLQIFFTVEVWRLQGPHTQLINLLNRILVQQVGDDGVVSPQNAVALESDRMISWAT
jgi:hypothetical protein